MKDLKFSFFLNKIFVARLQNSFQNSNTSPRVHITGVSVITCLQIPGCIRLVYTNPHCLLFSSFAFSVHKTSQAVIAYSTSLQGKYLKGAPSIGQNEHKQNLFYFWTNFACYVVQN